MQFENGASVTGADAAGITSQVVEELQSWGTLNVIRGSAGAEFILRGTLSRQGGGNFVLSGTTLSANEQVLNEYSETAQSIAAISIEQFCAKAAERIPLPNYLLGTWQSSINMPDGPVVCIIEFKPDRVASVERYDTWEHRQNHTLRYEGFGSGTYTYTGYSNRVVTINSRQTRIDAIASVNLTLEETLPDDQSVNRSNLQILFNSEKTSFEILNNILPCGKNYARGSTTPSETFGYTHFSKIR